jgi:hypothetical protein
MKERNRIWFVLYVDTSVILGLACCWCNMYVFFVFVCCISHIYIHMLWSKVLLVISYYGYQNISLWCRKREHEHNLSKFSNITKYSWILWSCWNCTHLPYNATAIIFLWVQNCTILFVNLFSSCTSPHVLRIRDLRLQTNTTGVINLCVYQSYVKSAMSLLNGYV